MCVCVGCLISAVVVTHFLFSSADNDDDDAAFAPRHKNPVSFFYFEPTKQSLTVDEKDSKSSYLFKLDKIRSLYRHKGGWEGREGDGVVVASIHPPIEVGDNDIPLPSGRC